MGGFPSRSDGAVGEDISKMISEITPGRKGGKFQLSFGGHLFVHPNIYGRNDVISCCAVSPTNRFKYLPSLQEHDHVISEVILVSSNNRSSRIQGVSIRIPCARANPEICDVILMFKSLREESWIVASSTFSDSECAVEAEVEQNGVLVVISSPRLEIFNVPVNGCLYNSNKLSRQISVRFPKKAVDTDMECEMRILPLNRRVLPVLRQENPRVMADMVTASDLFDILPSIKKEFKRPITLKLPLPPLETEEFSEADMVVLIYSGDEWRPLETNYKFTKTSISFETRYLSRFCVALAKPQRIKKLKEVFQSLQREMFTTRGDIIPFFHIQPKCWTLWFDCMATEDIPECVNERLQQGFKRIERTEFYGQSNGHDSAAKTGTPVQISSRQSWRSRSRMSRRDSSDDGPPKRTDLDLNERIFYELDIGGDIKIAEEDTGISNDLISYREMLRTSYRRFTVIPRGSEEDCLKDDKTLTAVVRIWTDLPEEGATITDGQAQAAAKRRCIRTFDFDIEPAAIKAFFYVEPEPEPEHEPEAIQGVIIETPAPEASLTKPKMKTSSADSFLRLITPTKPPRQVSKESKVLTGRSLMCLAREIEQGLTLAIYLDINDSTITGMGFDALAKGQNLVDITYRILLLWKRQTSRYKNRQVEILVEALREMGKIDVADIVLEKHRANVELTSECFDIHDG